MQSKWQQACTKKNLKKFTYIRANILSDDVYLGATIRKLEGGSKKNRAGETERKEFIQRLFNRENYKLKQKICARDYIKIYYISLQFVEYRSTA
jgi:hypothetical protein